MKKILLAYSGGLDTSVILKWLIESHNAEVVTFAADIGQEEELDGLDEKASATGACGHYTVDLSEEFAAISFFPWCGLTPSMRINTFSVPPSRAP